MKTLPVLLIIALLNFCVTIHARGCSRFPPTPCGEVENRSSHTLKYTTILDDNCKKGPNACDVWNSNSGCTIPNSPGLRRVSCKQCDLVPNKRIGGGNVDVDAFTYADREYIVAIRGGKGVTVAKGVWTKISSSETASCYDNSILNKPACFVEFDPTIKIGRRFDEVETVGYELLSDQIVVAVVAPKCPKPSKA